MLIFLGLWLLTLGAFGAEKENKIVSEMKAKGFIVLIDRDQKPTEVQIESIGKTIVCLSREGKNKKEFAVFKEMFPKGHYSVLILCAEGDLFIKGGYV